MPHKHTALSCNRDAWYAYYPYRAEFGEEFSTVAISGVLEPGASDPQMRDFSGTEI